MTNENNILSEYDTQAILFLRKYKLNFSVSYVGYGKHFPDDKENRDIYNLTLSSITDPRKRVTFKFGQSIIDSETNTPPTPYALLASITKYDPGSFEEFCSSFGYETDSRKALRTYKGVKREWEKVSNFFAGMGTALSELEEIN